MASMNNELEQMEQEDLSDGSSEELMENDEDEGESNDSDDEQEELAERNLVDKINRLQDEISGNLHNYEKHEQLISALRTLGELDLLRDSRERMRLLFPLPESIWLQWLDDEKKLIATPKDSAKYLELYELALADFLSPNIWLSYCEYAIDEMSTADMRRVFERAVNAVGTHFTQGKQFWNMFQSKEKAFLSSLTDPAEIAAQTERYIKLFERQFEIPLEGMEDDLEKLKASIDLTKQSSKIEESFNKSLRVVKEYQEFEKKIAQQSDASKKSELYKDYLEVFSKKSSSPSIICLYERAVCECYNDESLWIEYLIFCDSKLVLPDLLYPTYERALRNVSWSSTIWIRYLHSQERLCLGTDEKSLEECSTKIIADYKRAVSQGFQAEDYKNIIVCVLNHLRRKFTKLNAWGDDSRIEAIREQFQKPVDQFVTLFGSENGYELKKILATIEVKFLKSKENAKKVFEELGETNYKYYASFWIDYANFERENGSPEEYKSILLKGLNTCYDYPESIGQLLLKHQQEECLDLNDLLVLEAKVKAVNKKMIARRAKEEAQNRAREEAQIEEAVPRNDNKKAVANSKKRKNEENNDHNSQNKKAKKQPDVANGKHGKTVETDPSKVAQTVILKNLSFDLNEDEIKKEFLKFGDINDVRLVRNYKGASKGYCYVEFKNEISVHEAVRNDRMLIGGRPVYIDQMDKKPTLQYNQGAEKSKLFVKNIPLSYTKEDVVNKIFLEYKESVKEVRLVTYKNGVSKGWAYVEMMDAKVAEEAVKAKNDQEIEDKKLFVAISDPSKSVKATSSFNDRFAVPERGSNPRLRVGAVNPMIPSSVRIRPSTSGTQRTPNSGDNPPSQPLSQDDFRSFLTKK